MALYAQGSAEDMPEPWQAPVPAGDAAQSLPTDVLALASAQQLVVDLPPPVSPDWLSLFDRTLFTITPCFSAEVSHLSGQRRGLSWQQSRRRGACMQVVVSWQHKGRRPPSLRCCAV